MGFGLFCFDLGLLIGMGLDVLVVCVYLFSAFWGFCACCFWVRIALVLLFDF